VFLKLCELRRIITSAPDERNELERAVESQLEGLLRALPVNIAVSGFSNCFSRPVDGAQLDVITRVFGRVGRSDIDPLTEVDGEVRE